eukprot:6178171-Pleurochrysis_carterae.AAC.2
MHTSHGAGLEPVGRTAPASAWMHEYWHMSVVHPQRCCGSVEQPRTRTHITRTPAMLTKA